MALMAGSLSAYAQQATNKQGDGQQTFNEMTYSKEATAFRLNAPSKAKGVKIHIYNEGAGGDKVQTVKMKRTATDTWTANVKGDLKGKFYTFQVETAKKTMQETPGVFAKAVGVNGKRAAVIDMAETNPEGWDADKRPLTKSPTDLVIYELHHRDFSISPTSGLKNKGKFLALTEPKAIYYLKTLGVNAIHILPSFDFASVDESQPDVAQYNWGYDPLNYNVPEGSYSTDATKPSVRIKEFKQMVQELHKAGIRVILDVVYNHTFNINESNFTLTYPGYYYRTTKDGKPSDGSGCGNETASEKPLMREFMIESALYWAKEYHIDGFRFDLMGVHDIETMNLVRKALDTVDPNIYIYGEGWSAGQCAYPTEKLATKANTKQLDRIGAFCDDMRDGIRGPFSDDHKSGILGAIANNEESIKFGIAGCIDHPQIDLNKVNYSKAAWTNSPAQMIAYVSYHLCRRICPCSLRVVHLVEVYLRMVDATSDTKLYALLVVGNGAKNARLMVVAERTANAIAHIVAESSYAVKLLGVGFCSQFLCRISTLSCAPSLTIYIYVRIYGVESLANEVHGFDVVNAHEVEAETIDVVFLSPI